MEIKEIKKLKKNLPRFFCEKCDFKCYMKCDWERHITRPKHVLSSELEMEEIEKKLKKTYFCNCGKNYETYAGFWKHKQKCSFVNNNEKDNDNEEIKEPDNNLIQYLINENKELKNMVLEVCKQIQPSQITNTHTINNNCNNKTFNLQVFLNETCKDAMNISDFVESIKLQLSDLENVGKVGYIEGISNIIIKNLKALDVEKRPVHCTDQKREVIYVKEDNIWEKEDETNKKLRKAIRLVAHKNICMLKAFRDKYPDCEEYDSKKSSQYNKLVIEAMGGKGDNDYEKNTKIIKKIAKVVGIEKN